jgi:hypothetical protein
MTETFVPLPPAGFLFMPRIADLAGRQLCKMDRKASHGDLDPAAGPRT